MQLIVSPEIFDLFPGLTLAVAVANSIDNRTSRPELIHDWQAAWAAAAIEGAAYSNAQSHPRVQPWRERFRAMGVSGKEFPSSIEALLRRALKGGEPFTINPLVDFYNTISLRHFVPAGGFDLDQITGPLELRLTRADDRFSALDTGTEEALRPGEVTYTDGSTVLTRHFVWRQSRTAALSPETRSLFLVAEVLGEVGRGVAEQVLVDCEEGLLRHFGVPSHLHLADRENPVVEF